MPAPNDLTPEEEAEFVNHGVQPAGPGSEPIIENEGDQQQQQQQADEGSQQQAEEDAQQHGDRPRRADGTFKSAAEIAAEQQAAKGVEGEQGQGQQEEQKMVPLAAVHAERERFKAVARRLQLAETRMNQMLSNQQEQGQQQQEMPKLEEDPAGYIMAMERRLAQFEETRQVDAETRQIDTALESEEAVFSMTTPDYQQASEYYIQSRAQELLQFYDPKDAQKIMLDEARQIAREAWKRGRPAPEVIYGLAQARGYTAGQQQGQGQQGQGQQGQQQGQGQQGRAQEVVRSTAKAQASSRSLSGGRGATTQALNAQALLDMSDEEFEEQLALGSKGANARFAAIG